MHPLSIGDFEFLRGLYQYLLFHKARQLYFPITQHHSFPLYICYLVQNKGRRASGSQNAEPGVCFVRCNDSLRFQNIRERYHTRFGFYFRRTSHSKNLLPNVHTDIGVVFRIVRMFPALFRHQKTSHWYLQF